MTMPLAAVLVLFVGGLAVWAALAWRAETVRRRGLVAAGRPRQLRLDSSDPFYLAETHFGLNLFTRGHSRLVSNVLHGRVRTVAAGMPDAGQAEPVVAVRVFDYQYETGSGKSRRTHRWQVALVRTDLSWPAMLCQPTARHDPLEAVFGMGPVPFVVDPFASRFRVVSEDADFAYRLLHAQLADLLAGHPDVTFETQAETVAVYQPGPLPPQQAVDLLELACQILQLLPPSLREEMRQG